MKTLIASLILVVTLGAGCAPPPRDPEIVGKWKNVEDPSNVLVFEGDGTFDWLNEKGSVIKGVIAQLPYPISTAKITYKTNTDVTPFELSLDIHVLGAGKEIPLALYRFEEDKLVIQFSNSIEETLMGMEVGKKKLELPSEITEKALIFERVE